MTPRLILAVLAIGCSGDIEETDTDQPDDTDVPTVESECNDGADNDDDGAIDCDDSDCADAFECNWPDAMNHDTQMDFAGRTIECKFAGISIPYDVEDCQTRFTAALTYDPNETGCTSCDRVYKGPLNWLNDSCSELLGETGPKPEVTEYGIEFVSETERRLYVNDATTGWTSTVTLTLNGTSWENITEVPIEEDIDDCNNGVQYLGDLTVRVGFTDQ